MRYMTLCLLLCLTGCSVLRTAGEAVRVETTGPPAVEPAPVPPEPLLERVREQVAYAHRVLADAWASGVDALNSRVGAARDGLAFVLAHQGAPARVPDDETVTESLGDGQEHLDIHRAALDAWWDEMAEASRTPSKRTWSIGSPLLGTKLLLGGLGALSLTVLGLARKLGSKSTALGQVVGSVSSMLEKLTPTDKAAAKREMARHQDLATEALVGKLKAGGR